MAEIICLDNELLAPIHKKEFLDLLRRFGSKSWRIDWAVTDEGEIMMVAELDGRKFIGHVTSAFERISQNNGSAQRSGGEP